ncbi:MAG: sulfotransferase family 2 domain-containing protein [Microscillaceae bacterium]|jgi:hypothetical protein|nr:sulfotransferase family 2 domain-containing protein [Microscillaceae bacterium]
MATNQNPRIIFLHIPKTGGMSLYNVLGNQFKKREIFTIPIINKRPAHYKFLDLPQAEKEEIRLLRGHMPFGYHQYFNSPSRYITVLREPVKRVISHYYYVLSRPNHYLYEVVTSRNMTVEEYVVSDITHELDNGQTRSISGIPPEEKCTEEALQMAIKNLDEHFLLASVLDYFDETLIMLKEELGWGYPVYYNENINKKKPTAPVSNEIKKQIAERNKYDIQLYNYVKQKIEAQINANADHIAKEVKKLKWLCYPYQKYGQMRQFLKGVIKGK